MNDAVKSVADETVTADSQPAQATQANETHVETQPQEQQTATDSVEESDNSGSGVTTSDKSEDEVVEHAKDEVQSPRGQNRVQELANRLKDAESKVRQYEQGLYQQPQPTTAQQAQYQNQQYAQLNAMKQRLLEQRVAAQEEKLLFDELAKEAPELNPSSDNYSKEWDDIVYEGYLSGKDPREVIATLKKIEKRAESRRGEAREQAEEAKSKELGGAVNRSNVSDTDTTAQEQARKRFSETGSFDDLLRVQLD